jgi:hypothetical protein
MNFFEHMVKFFDIQVEFFENLTSGLSFILKY